MIIYEYNNYNKYYHTYCAFISALMKLTSLTAEAAEAFRTEVEGHWPKGALLYMINIKRFYVVHEQNENF